MSTLETLRYGSLKVSVPEGNEYVFRGEELGANADLVILDWQGIHNFYRKGSIGFAEAYRDQLIDSSDITALLICAIKNQHIITPTLGGGLLFKTLSNVGSWLFPNNRTNSRKNIHSHYDLGNSFYKLWLDESMHYSSALFVNDTATLEQGQTNKCLKILESLLSRSGKMLEIGCGWGGFAQEALSKGDFDYKGITISQEQFNYSRALLNGRGTVAFEDYRDQQGTYENIVSIEMFEAVGKKYWKQYFNQIKQLLAPNGKALIQTITIADKFFATYLKRSDFIRSFIFPGGLLPSPKAFKQYAEKAGFKITSQLWFGEDYSKTLSLWLQKFEVHLPQIRTLGFEESFIRLWRMYLAACIANFSLGDTNVAQFRLEHV